MQMACLLLIINTTTSLIMLILLNSNILFKIFTEGDEINGHKNHNFVKFLDNLVTFPSFSHQTFSHFYYLKNWLYLQWISKQWIISDSFISWLKWAYGVQNLFALRGNSGIRDLYLEVGSGNPVIVYITAIIKTYNNN